jgi:uncharacterized protein involved in exopolysaccharide biosynthesis
MSSSADQNGYRQDELIDLVQLWETLWKERILIIAVTASFALASVVYAFVQTDIYRSQALLVPAEAAQPSNPLLSQLGVAAGLVGINAGNQSAQVTTALATLKSREFLRQFIVEHKLKPALFGLKQVEELELPSDQLAITELNGILSVTEDQSNGLITVAIEWHNPQQAKDWVTWLIDDVNELIKQQDLRESTSAIEYLQEQLQSTQLVEMQRAFYQLIESQTRIVMLADVRDDYVFRVVDPAYVPGDKIKPRRSVIVIAGTVLGGALAVLLALIRNTKRK